MITATAKLNGVQCQVVVERDLEANYSVVVYSGIVDSVSLIPRKAAPLIVKVNAKSAWLAADAVLKGLKAKGRIEEYELGPRPEAEVKAEEEAKAKAAAKKAAMAGAGKKPAAAEDDEEEEA